MTEREKDIEALAAELIRQKGMTKEQAMKVANQSLRLCNDVKRFTPVDIEKYYAKVYPKKGGT